jgi:hypothetical protein
MKQFPNDAGRIITCGNCGVKQNFYLDTHGVDGSVYMVGRCSNCSKMLTAKVYMDEDTIIYERGTNVYDIQQKNNRDDSERGGERKGS